MSTFERSCVDNSKEAKQTNDDIESFLSFTRRRKGLTEGDILAELRPIFKAYKHFKLVHPQVPPAAA